MKTYRSKPLEAVHETMESLHEIGAVDKRIMREFDEACLTPVAGEVTATMAGELVEKKQD